MASSKESSNPTTPTIINTFNNKRNIMKVSDLENSLTLYHGTSLSSAKNLIKNGWEPRSNRYMGSQQGNPVYLYLTTDIEDAEWFADEKENGVVIKVENIPLSYLKVDPEDGVGDTIDDEINSQHGLPGKLVLYKPLHSNHFSFVNK